MTWSPFAEIAGGCRAVQSVEVTPGVHRLLVGPVGEGNILARDLDVFMDNGYTYGAYAVLGSVVLAQPGQVAVVGFITTESVRTGTPLTLGLFLDEALPYYTGQPELLKQWVNDPPTLAPSKSLLAQRFYLAELPEDAPVVRHMQIQINWSPNDSVQNELLTLTVFGGFMQES